MQSRISAAICRDLRRPKPDSIATYRSPRFATQRYTHPVDARRAARDKVDLSPPPLLMEHDLRTRAFRRAISGDGVRVLLRTTLIHKNWVHDGEIDS